MIRALLIRPDGTGEVVPEVDPRGLVGIRQLVGGWVTMLAYPHWRMYVDEEGLLKHLPTNMAATLLAVQFGNGRSPGLLLGNAVVVGTGRDADTDVPDDALAVWEALPSIVATQHDQQPSKET